MCICLLPSCARCGETGLPERLECCCTPGLLAMRSQETLSLCGAQVLLEVGGVGGGCSTLPSQHLLTCFGPGAAFPSCYSQDHTSSCLPLHSVPMSPLGCISPTLASFSSSDAWHAVSCIWHILMQSKTSRFLGLSLT